MVVDLHIVQIEQEVQTRHMNLNLPMQLGDPLCHELRPLDFCCSTVQAVSGGARLA